MNHHFPPDTFLDHYTDKSAESHLSPICVRKVSNSNNVISLPSNHAIALLVQVMEARTAKLGADHPSTLTSMANLASTLWNQGRWGEVEKLEVQVMETRTAKLGANHLDTLTSMANLAYTYRSQDRLTEAVNLMRRCIKRQEARLGVQHPACCNNAVALARWESSLGIVKTGGILLNDLASGREKSIMPSES